MTDSQNLKLMREILEFAHLTELPNEVTEETKLWVRAIGYVRKQNGEHGWVVMQREHDMTVRPIKTVGSMSPVAVVEKYYPYILLDKKYIKGFRTDASKPRIEYLQSLKLPYFSEKDFENMTLAQLNKEIVGAAIYLQIKDLSN